MCLSFRTLSGWTLQTFQFQNVVLKCTVAYESVSRVLIDLGKGKSVDFCGVGCWRWDELLDLPTSYVKQLYQQIFRTKVANYQLNNIYKLYYNVSFTG